MGRRAGGTVAAVLLVVLAACGGGTKGGASGGEGESAAAGSSTTVPSADGAGPGGASSKNGAASKKGAGASGGTAMSTTQAGAKAGPEAPKEASAPAAEDDPWKEPLEMAMVLSQECVRPGATQTVTFVAPPGTGVGYNTYYADGKSGLSEGFYGGNSGGYTDETGTWANTFTVAANAPAGQAVVLGLGTGARSGRGETSAAFYVADLTGLCDIPEE